MTQRLLRKSVLASGNVLAVTSPSSVNLFHESLSAANVVSFSLGAGPCLKGK